MKATTSRLRSVLVGALASGALLALALANGCAPSATPASSAPPSVVDGGSDGPPGVDASKVPQPPTPPDGKGWVRTTLDDMPAEWAGRDGAQMVQLASGRILMVGGWNAEDPWGPNSGQGNGGAGDRVTNEVWKSDDLGVTWSLLLAHDPAPTVTGPNARFLPGHTVGLATFNGHAVLIGSEPDGAIEDYLGDVWHESNNGATWTRVATTAPTLGRALFMCATYKAAIYVMGGQASLFDPTTAMNDVWRSTDGGVSWTRLANAPWSPRGMVYRPAEHAGKLVIIGGGRYANDPFLPVVLNGVFAFDGTTWETILPDGHPQFVASFYNPIASLDGRLWLFNGYNSDMDIEFSRATISDDNGLTWTSFAGGSGGPESHADAVLAVGGRILRVSGSLNERAVYSFARQ